MSCTSWAAATSARSWPRLCAQQGAFAFYVHQAQFGRGPVRQYCRRRRAATRLSDSGPIEPGAQMTEHRAILGRERHAEVGSPALRRSGKQPRRRCRSHSRSPAYTRRAGSSGEIVVVVLGRSAAAARPRACARAAPARPRRPALHARRASRRDVRREPGKKSSPRARARLAASNCRLFARWHGTGIHRRDEQAASIGAPASFVAIVRHVIGPCHQRRDLPHAVLPAA